MTVGPTDAAGPGPSDGRPRAGRAEPDGPPPRTLSDRAAAYVAERQHGDRRQIIERRFELVGAVRARARKRRVIAAAVAAVALTAAGGWWYGWPGALVGLAIVGVLLAGLRVSQWVLARTRGASGWSWQTQRYVAIGSPAREVQRLDEPDRGTQRTGGREAPPRPAHHQRRPDDR